MRKSSVSFAESDENELGLPSTIPIGRDGAGFTFIECLVVAAVLAVIGSIALVSFLNSRNIHDVAASAQNVVSLIRLAQSRTSAGEDASPWGVYLENSRVTIFRGTSYASATLREAHPLPQSIRLTNIALAGGGSEIVFKSLTGETDQYGSFSLTVQGATGLVKSIVIERTGRAYESQTGFASTNTRIIDARHRTYQLGWSIQGGTNLILTFSDTPNPDTVSTVPMAGFFNAGQTKFDWSGTVAVGGVNQVLRIHTLALSAGDTTLSIDRDCRTNNKKVAVKIDASLIATYEADCRTITVGPFGGTITEP